MKRTTLILLGVLVLAAIGGAFLFRQKQDVSKTSSTNLNQDAQTPGTSQENTKENNQNPILQPSSEYSIRPDFSKVKDFTKTLMLQRGVSVKYGDGWVGKKTGGSEFVNGQLIKTVNGRSYLINFQENGVEFFSPDLQKNSIQSSAYQEIQINGKSHFIFVVSNVSSENGRYDFTYLVSPCPAMQDKACSLPLKGGLLYVSLEQYVLGAQEAKPLDFSRKDDQQILAEFAEIASTLQY